MMRGQAVQRVLRLDLQLRLGWLLWFLVGGIALFGWGWWISIVYDFGMADESWFLQVLTRVVDGDVLYRDVFFGATPLAVYLGAALVRLFGSEIVVLKAFVAICFTFTVLFCSITLRLFNVSYRSHALLLLGTLAYVWPRQAAGYTPLSYACLLGCLAIMVAWSRSHAQPIPTRSITLLAVAGGVAGLCFGAKQNVGVYVFGAVLAVAVVMQWLSNRNWRSVWVSIAVPLVAFLLVGGISILPVLLSGGFSQFVDYGFTNKRTYLQVGGFSYRDELQALVKRAKSIASFDDAHFVHLQTIFLLPPLTLAMFLAACVVGTVQQRRNLAISAVFVVAALLGVYPRADTEHVIYAVPPLLLCLVYAGSIVAARFSVSAQHIMHWCLVGWFMLGIGLVASGGINRMTSPSYEQSSLPHFRGVWLTKREHTTLHSYITTLQTASAGQPLFVLNNNAGFYYLAADLDNPTPFDYPLVTAFGLHGQAEVMSAITEGRLSSVCMTKSRRYRLAPYELEKFVAANMEPVQFSRPCVMYQTRLPKSEQQRAAKCDNEIYERGCAARSRPSSR